MRSILLKTSVILASAALVLPLIPHTLLCDSESTMDIAFNHEASLALASEYNIGISTSVPAKKTRPHGQNAIHQVTLSAGTMVTVIIICFALPLTGSPVKYMTMSRSTYS